MKTLGKCLITIALISILLIGCSPAAGDEISISTQASQIEPTITESPTSTVILPTEPVRTHWTDIPFTDEDMAFQKLDVYFPDTGNGPFPTILTIHGGGFRSRSKSLYYLMSSELTELGYAVVSTNYRLRPNYSYPAQVEDVFCALAWVHSNYTTYGFDREKIYVMGDSAGGYLAAMVGTVEAPDKYLTNCPYTLPESDWIQGAVIYYGFFDLSLVRDLTGGDAVGYMGGSVDSLPPETIAEMSPMAWVDGSEPPFLLIHGTQDTSVPSWMSEDFAEALGKVGVPSELVLLDENHAFILQPMSSPANTRSLEAIETFLSKLPNP